MEISVIKSLCSYGLNDLIDICLFIVYSQFIFHSFQILMFRDFFYCQTHELFYLRIAYINYLIGKFKDKWVNINC